MSNQWREELFKRLNLVTENLYKQILEVQSIAASMRVGEISFPNQFTLDHGADVTAFDQMITAISRIESQISGLKNADTVSPNAVWVNSTAEKDQYDHETAVIRRAQARAQLNQVPGPLGQPQAPQHNVANLTSELLSQVASTPIENFAPQQHAPQNVAPIQTFAQNIAPAPQAPQINPSQPTQAHNISIAQTQLAAEDIGIPHSPIQVLRSAVVSQFPPRPVENAPSPLVLTQPIIAPAPTPTPSANTMVDQLAMAQVVTAPPVTDEISVPVRKRRPAAVHNPTNMVAGDTKEAPLELGPYLLETPMIKL